MLARPKLKLLSLAIAIAWAASECLAFQASISPEVRQRYIQARRLLSLGEKEEALAELKAIIQLAPEFVEAHRDYLDNQRDKAASFIETYEGYVKQNPNSAVYHYLLGKVYSSADKREQADAEFKKALELGPKFAWAMFAMSTVTARANDNARTLQLLEEASKHAGDSIALRVSLAGTYLNRKMYEQALAEAERGLQIDPQEFSLYTTKWQARLSLTLGDDQTRAEVLREIQELEAKHGQDINALLKVQSGYQMLDDEKRAEQAKKAILAIDPKYFERQPFSFFIGTASGKTIQLRGPNARLFIETTSMKDDKQKLEVYKKLETSFDEDAKLYVLYPSMLRSYIALKDIANAERITQLLTKGDVSPQDLAGHRVMLARAYLISKTKLDDAFEYLRLAVEQYRKPLSVKDGKEPPEHAKEDARRQLFGALHLQGQILLEKDMTDKAVPVLEESVKIEPYEESLYDLGRAYVKLGRKDEAVEALSKAYAYGGKRQQESRLMIKKIYGSRAKTRPLESLLAEAVETHRARVRDAAIIKAVREITKTEPKEAPAFQLTTLSGQKVQLVDLRGKVILMSFWATW